MVVIRGVAAAIRPVVGVMRQLMVAINIDCKHHYQHVLSIFRLFVHCTMFTSHVICYEMTRCASISINFKEYYNFTKVHCNTYYNFALQITYEILFIRLFIYKNSTMLMVKTMCSFCRAKKYRISNKICGQPHKGMFHFLKPYF